MLHTVAKVPWRKSSKRKSRCLDVTELYRKHQVSEKKDRSKEKDKPRSSFAPGKHGGGGKGASSKNAEPLGSRRKPRLKLSLEPRRHTMPLARDVRSNVYERHLKFILEGKLYCFSKAHCV